MKSVVSYRKAYEMKILVCVKQVPDMESLFRINAQGNGYEESGLVFRMNDYDVYAVEEAVRIKETWENVDVTALSIGPGRAEQVVRRALEIGADRGAHILLPEGSRPDGLQTATLIASFAEKRSFDLLLFGIMSEDAQRCQTGPMVAALLDLPFASTVISQKLTDGRTGIMVEREQEAGRREVVYLPLPCLLTIQSGINLPRYPSLSNKLRARGQELETLHCKSFDLKEMCEIPVRTYHPPPLQEGIFIEGNMEDQAEQLVRLIHERTDVL